MNNEKELREAIDERIGKALAYNHWYEVDKILMSCLGVSLDDLVDEEIDRQFASDGLVQYEAPEATEDGKEYYGFYVKRADEAEWGLKTRFEMKDDMIHYTALTTLRTWITSGVNISFD